VRVALVEDDPHQGQLMALWMSEHEMACQVYATGADFTRAMARESFDVVILDWMLPDTSGDQLLVWLREQGHTDLPVIFVTARDSEADIVTALTLGADDYITKPVRRDELLARLQAVYRRAHRQAAGQAVLDHPPYRIALGARTIELGGVPVDLTDKEYEVALLLFRNIGRVISRGHILETVWGKAADLNTRTVDTHMSRLRTKLDIHSARGWRLSAVYSHGYRLEALEDKEGA
jgi:two-component system, OmpR family, response regulator RegX3